MANRSPQPFTVSRSRPPLFQRDWPLGILVGVIALAVYLATLAPTLSWAHHGADGGDLITAARALGVPHPPGYPLYVLTAHLWSALPLPAGDLAYRFNLFSALCSAGAAALLSVTIARSRWAGPFAGLIGGLTFAFGPIFWSQAVITEVYALNSLLVAGSLLALLSLPAGGGFLWGLSWTTHLTSAFFFPLALWWGGRRALSWRGRARFVAGWLLGLLPFLWLPFFAARRPVINWGNPVTPARWWWVVSGALYRDYPFGLALADWPGRLAELGRFAAQQLTWPGLGLALWGVVWLAGKSRSFCLALLAPAGLITLWALGYDTTDSHVLLIPVWMIGALFLGFGISGLSRWRGFRWLAVLIPIALLLVGWPDANLRHDQEAADFGRRVMDQAPADALLYTTTDAQTFALWYYRHAEGWRSDLTIVDQDMLAEEWYQTMLASQDPRWPDSVPGRPICIVSQSGLLNCDE